MEKYQYNRIQEVLDEKNKDVYWLQTHLEGETIPCVVRWCKNVKQPTIEQLFEIARVLEVDVRELIVSTDSQFTPHNSASNIEKQHKSETCEDTIVAKDEILPHFQGKDNVRHYMNNNGAESWLTQETSFGDETFVKGACKLNTVENDTKHVLFLFNSDDEEVGRYYIGKSLQGKTPSELVEIKSDLVFFESWNPESNSWVPCVDLSTKDDHSPISLRTIKINKPINNRKANNNSFDMDFKEALKEILKIRGISALEDHSTLKLLEDYGAFDEYPIFRSIMENIIEMKVGEMLQNTFYYSFEDKGQAWSQMKKKMIEGLPYDEVFMNLFFDDLECAFLIYAHAKDSSERDMNTEVEEMLGQVWTDQRGVKYSTDKKKLINASKVEGSYSVNPETEYIDSYAFLQNRKIERVSLPSKLKKIGCQAFHCCSSLNKIIFQGDVSEIGEYAFGGNPSLTEVYLPNGLQQISDGLFSVCTNLLYVHIPKSVTHIGDRAFCDCLSLQFLVIPDDVISIGETAFDYCNSLRYIVLPEGIAKVGSKLFDTCKSLESVYIPEGSLLKFSQLFPDYTHLFKEYNKDKIKSIGTIHDNTLPFWITRNGEIIMDTFYNLKDEYDYKEISNCEDEKSHIGFIRNKKGEDIHLSPILKYKTAAEIITIGDKITVAIITINSGKDWIHYAYMTDYEKFDSIFDTLPSKCYYESKGHNMCSHIRQSDIDNYIIDDKGVVYSADKKRLIKAPTDIVEYIIPYGVDVICDDAFNGCTDLKTLSISASVVFIGDFAFNGCHLLDNLTIPCSVLFIGKSAFRNCKLHNLQIDNGLISIGDWAFDSCRIKNLVLPDSIRYIGRGAFKLCRLLKELNFPESIVYIGEGAFYGLVLRHWKFPNLPLSFVQRNQYFNNDPHFTCNSKGLRFNYPDKQ